MLRERLPKLTPAVSTSCSGHAVREPELDTRFFDSAVTPEVGTRWSDPGAAGAKLWCSGPSS